MSAENQAATEDEIDTNAAAESTAEATETADDADESGSEE